MKMRKSTLGVYILRAAVLLMIISFIIKFGAPAILKLYIKAGVGTCSKLPILCMGPSADLIGPEINKKYITELRPYRFTEMEVYLPKGFNVVQEKIRKAYYKKNKRKGAGSVVYLLCKNPGFFMNLFPQLQKQGVTDDYAFIMRTMYAKTEEIKNITDAFFVIMKGVFIPDLGEQKNVKMARFSIADKKGFLNYNIGESDNYFDCNIFNERGFFFKIYIREKGTTLDLDKVLTIISTVKEQ